MRIVKELFRFSKVSENVDIVMSNIPCIFNNLFLLPERHMLSHEYVCKEKTKNNFKNRSVRTRFRSHSLLVHSPDLSCIGPGVFWKAILAPAHPAGRRLKPAAQRRHWPAAPALRSSTLPAGTVRKLHQLPALQAARARPVPRTVLVTALRGVITSAFRWQCGQLAAAASKALRSCAASESACPRGGARANAHLAQLRLHVLQHLVQARRAPGSR